MHGGEHFHQQFLSSYLLIKFIPVIYLDSVTLPEVIVNININNQE